MITYSFVDGEYLQREVKAVLERNGLSAAEPITLRNLCSAKKIFYYDSLPARKPGETNEDFEARRLFKRKQLDKFSLERGVHCREGFSRFRRGQLQQKGVDVLLAVEALQNSFQRNMDVCQIVTGDLDFAPLVDALVTNGVEVHLKVFANSASEDLVRMADFCAEYQPYQVLNALSEEMRIFSHSDGWNGVLPSNLKGLPIDEVDVLDNKIHLIQEGSSWHSFSPHGVYRSRSREVAIAAQAERIRYLNNTSPK